jgi:peptidoglycan-associated lipoprotein
MLCTLLAACSTEPTTSAAANPAPAAAVAAKSATTLENESAQRERILKNLAGKSIYFDYDNFSIKPEYLALLKQDYELLKAMPKLAIRLEGNADERGSTEYNLALGQKRAEAVQRALTLLGLPGAQVEAISYGKEKPRATCRDDKCFAENRRVDFADRKP